MLNLPVSKNKSDTVVQTKIGCQLDSMQGVDLLCSARQISQENYMYQLHANKQEFIYLIEQNANLYTWDNMSQDEKD